MESVKENERELKKVFYFQHRKKLFLLSKKDCFHKKERGSHFLIRK